MEFGFHRKIATLGCWKLNSIVRPPRQTSLITVAKAAKNSCWSTVSGLHIPALASSPSHPLFNSAVVQKDLSVLWKYWFSNISTNHPEDGTMDAVYN